MKRIAPLFLFLVACAPPPPIDNEEGSTLSDNSGAYQENINPLYQTDSSLSKDSADKKEALQVKNIPEGEYTIEAFREALTDILANKKANVTVYDDSEAIKNYRTYDRGLGTFELLLTAITDDGEMFESSTLITIITEGSKGGATHNRIKIYTGKTSNGTPLYNLFPEETYSPTEIKAYLKQVSVDKGNTLEISANEKPIKNIDEWEPSLGKNTVRLEVTDSAGTKSDKTVNIAVVKNPSTNGETFDGPPLYNLFPADTYAVNDLKNQLKRVSVDPDHTLTMSSNGLPIEDIDLWQPLPGVNALHLKVTDPSGQTTNKFLNVNVVQTEEPEGNATIYNLFPSGTYQITEFKNKLKAISTDDDNFLTLYHNTLPIYHIDSWDAPLGVVVIEIEVFELTKDNVKTQRKIEATIVSDDVRVGNATIHNLFSGGTYTPLEIKNMVKVLAVDTGHTLTVYDGDALILDANLWMPELGETTLTFEVVDLTDLKTERTVDITITPEEPPTGNAKIYNVFDQGYYQKTELKYKLKKVSVDKGNSLAIFTSLSLILDIDRWKPTLGQTKINLVVTEPSGLKTNKEIIVNIEDDTLKLKRVNTKHYSRVWTTEGCGWRSDNWGLHKPNAPAGFKPLGHVLSYDGYWLGNGTDFFVAKEDQEGLVIAPKYYMQVYYTYGGGCDFDNVRFWRPYAPAGFYCLGDFALDSDINPNSNVKNPPVLCVKESFMSMGGSDSWKVGDDDHTGIDHADRDFYQCGGSSNFNPRVMRVTDDEKPGSSLCRAIDDTQVEWVD